MAHSIQHMQSRRAEQWLTPSSTCNGSLHPAHAKPESRAMAHSIQHMQSRRAEQWFTPSSTCKAGEQSNGSLHPAQPQQAANHFHTSAYICCTLVHALVYTCTCTVCVKKNFPYRWNIYTHFLFDYRHNSIVVVPTTGMV